MEKVLCFMSTILQTSPDVKGSVNIRKRITQRLLDWENKKYLMLISSTVLCAEAQMNRKRGVLTIKERAKIFSSLICRGKLRAAIRYASEREKGGILMPGDVDEKSGDLVSGVLASEHPIGRDVEISSLPIFEFCPELINIEVTEDSVEKVARRLSGSAGPSGIDSVAMSHWLLKFGGASSKLRRSIAKFVEWLSNDYPPWAAYRAMTWSRLVGLDKCPGVRPIGKGDILRRLLCKTLLIVVGKEATRAYGTDQLCSGLEAGIEGGIHHMRSMWDEHEGLIQYSRRLNRLCNYPDGPKIS